MKSRRMRWFSNQSRSNQGLIVLFVIGFGVVGSLLLNTGRASPLVATIKSGNWSDPATWHGNRVPLRNETVKINSNHQVSIDLQDVTVAGIHIEEGGLLQLDPSINIKLETSQNVVVKGVLRMKPASAAVNHTLRFINIDETKFVGGGMVPLDGDVGLWVEGAGQLDIAGTPKTAWITAKGSVEPGANSIQLNEVPVGWRAGDELAVSPTLPAEQRGAQANSNWYQFDEVKIASVSGDTVFLETPTKYNHPKVNNRWTAEVLNLTRNVEIEGTPTGRTHVFIHNTQPAVNQIKYSTQRYMGPVIGGRLGGTDEDSNVLGRYGIHFHHSEDNSRGSLVEGVVSRDISGHAFVPHASHGITFRNTIAYNNFTIPYWWDLNVGAGIHSGHTSESVRNFVSHDTVFENCVAAKIKPHGDDKRLYGFILPAGSNNTIKNCVAVGIQGTDESGGFHWPSQANGRPNVWNFQNNRAHNNWQNGIYTWQNTGGDHIVDGFEAYHNGRSGITHGAYNNHYIFRNLNLYGNLLAGIDQHALSGNSSNPIKRLTFENFIVANNGTPLLLGNHKQPSDKHALYRNCDIQAAGEYKVVVSESGLPGRYDLVNCGVEPAQIQRKMMQPESIVRVQRANGTAYQMDSTGKVTAIAAFYTPPSNADVIAPHAPASVKVAGSTKTSISLEWRSAVDNTRVKEYRVYRGGRLAYTTTATSGTDSNPNLLKDVSYVYEVTAIDEAGNESQKSQLVTASLHDTVTPPPLSPRQGDLNGDGLVTIFDLSLLMSKWQKTSNLGAADINKDGVVNIFDLSILMSNWGM